MERKVTTGAFTGKFNYKNYSKNQIHVNITMKIIS